MEQLDLTMYSLSYNSEDKKEKKHRNKLPDEEQKKRKEQEEAHRLFKIHKSGRPWRFSDKERKLLKDYYGIST